MKYVYGVGQSNQAPFSSEHWKLRPVSDRGHAKVLVALKVGLSGFVVRTGAGGGTVSSVTVLSVLVDAVVLALPARSWTVCAAMYAVMVPLPVAPLIVTV